MTSGLLHRPWRCASAGIPDLLAPTNAPFACEVCGAPLFRLRGGPAPKYCADHKTRSRAKDPDRPLECQVCQEPLSYKGMGPRPTFCGAHLPTRQPPEVVTQLVEQHFTLAQKYAQGYLRNVAGAERDDVFSDALYGLLIAARSWDADGGASFGTYLFKAVRTWVKRGFQDRHRRLAGGASPLVASLDEIRGGAHDDLNLYGLIPDPHDQYEVLADNEVYAWRQSWLQDAIDVLPAQEAFVLTNMVLGDWAVEDVTREQGWNRATVFNYRKKAIANLTRHANGQTLLIPNRQSWSHRPTIVARCAAGHTWDAPTVEGVPIPDTCPIHDADGFAQTIAGLTHRRPLAAAS